MLRLKTNVKILLTLGIMLAVILVFNINTVNATSEEQAQQLFDLIPESISIDIPEIEYEKADELIKQEIEEICIENNISTDEVKVSVSGTQLYFLDIHTANVMITDKNGGILKSKKISVVYNNTNKKNSTDEEYVKNLTSKLKSPRYYEVELNFYSDKIDFDTVFNNYFTMITDTYTKQINDESVTVKASAGAGGTDGGINVWTWESGTVLGVFKDGILYDVKKMGQELTVPVINIPDTVTKNEAKDYVINLIKENNKDFGEHIVRIEKGTKNKNEFYKLDIDIPNGYTVYANWGYEEDMPSYIIINGIDNIGNTTTDNANSVIVTDKETNIKLEANDSVVPNDVVLEVKPITEGTTFDNLKRLLSNVNKFKAFDITLKSNGVEIQPNGKVKVSIPIPDNFDKSKLIVYRVEDNGNKIEYKVTIVGNYAQFETDHFSKYVLAEIENNNNEKDDTPKTGTETNVMPYILGIIAVCGITFIIKIK